MAASIPSTRRIRNPILFICDLQEKFRSIHAYPNLLEVASKLLRFATALDFPIIATTQQRAKLGELCAELSLGPAGSGAHHTLAADVDKSAFSMWVPEVQRAIADLAWHGPDTGEAGAAAHSTDAATSATAMMDRSRDVLLVGIETHICVLQTTLDLLKAGHRVWVVADGVSSINPEERGVALARLRQEGARVTTSESVMYEVLGDSVDERFKTVAGLVKEEKERTKEGLKALCRF